MSDQNKLTAEEILRKSFNGGTLSIGVRRVVLEAMEDFAAQEKRPFQQEVFALKSTIKKLWDSGFDLDNLTVEERALIENISI